MAHWHEPESFGDRTTIAAGTDVRQEGMFFNLEIAVAHYLSNTAVREQSMT